MANGNQKNKQSNSRAPTTDKVWKDEEDSPIELAKVHPTIKRSIQGAMIFLIIDWGFLIGYIKYDWRHEENTMFDSFALAWPLATAIVVLLLISMVRISKVRE